jgi:peptidyl-prolyl cis-trans isomerase SurA
MTSRILLPILALVLASLASAPSLAQNIVVVVNGSAITELDVTNRQRLLALTGGGRAPTRQAVVDELIDERLKLLEARRLRITVTEAQVDQSFANIAQRARLNSAQLSQTLQGRGVNPRTLRERLRGDLAWQQVVQQRAQRMINIRDQDVIDAIRRRGQDPDRLRAVEYTMSQVVVFGSGADRRRVAEGLRSQINGCDTLLQRVRSVRDAAARDPIRRVSTDLPSQINEILAATPVGRASTVQQSNLGWEFVVICDKRDVPGREAATAQVRQELLGQEIEQASQRLLAEARQRAQIDRRR